MEKQKCEVPQHVRSVVNTDGAILMDVEAGSMFSLNPIGGLIWKRLQEGDTRDEISATISRDFAVPIEQVRADVDSFLSELDRNQLIK